MDVRLSTIVIGGGQAGLAAGFFLTRRGEDFVILDENPRAGDAWRRRWDSLRLFTPSRYSGLPGLPFPKPDYYYPTKDEVAAYLEAYTREFDLPIWHNVRVEALAPDAEGYRLTTSRGPLTARSVIVATGPFRTPAVPALAAEIDPSIQQLHSSQYRNPAQIPASDVLVVGAGTSGVEIALELARAGKRVWLAGRDVGRIPADALGRILGGKPYWWAISRLLSVSTPIGRKMRSQILEHGAPLIRTTRQDVIAAGVECLPRIAAVQSGRPQAADGRVLPAEAVVWATGYRPDFSWIHLPIFDAKGYPNHARGVVAGAPGLYFLGLPFQNALSSALIGGVGADAGYLIDQVHPNGRAR